MNKYKLGDISEIQSGPFGTQLHKDEYVSEGIPMLNSKNIGNGVVVEDSIDFVPKAVCERLPRYILKKGDILFGRAGTIERHTYVDSKYDGCFQGTNCIRIRCKDKQKSLYISYYLWLNELKVKIENAAVGSIQSYITTDLLKDIEIEIPDDYKKRANFLFMIDEKIHNNNQINDNLEQQLMLLYDYWFIQFDFPDNNGNPYQTSGGKMVWNDTLKRNIPENWKVQSVNSNCLSSIIKPGVEIFNTKKYLATADVKGTSISTGTIVDYYGRESRANMQPSINSVWFAKMKNSIKHLYLNKEMQPIISSSILSTGFCGLQCNEISFEYIASYISNAYFEIHKDMLAHGATQEAVNNDDLASIHIIIPKNSVLHAYHEATQAIYAQISKNICENQELVKLRNWLLPMLMNGQATISD